MLKASMSLAILALLGKVSASEVQNQLQQQHHRHRIHHVHHQGLSQKKSPPMANDGPPYADIKSGKEWYELHNADERIHGFKAVDDNSPYDPDVVDAPEDMKRVGNDHTPLHNAHLSPDGYYNGFHHKDFEGKYAQKKSTFAQQASKGKAQDDPAWKESPFYKYKNKDGTEWFELDNRTERLHGTEPMDDVQPYDAEVADAPEDMKRVGNDHEELHNAKLAPDGYYTGFYHKDYKGNYAQVARFHNMGHKMSQRGRHAADKNMIQYRENDTDDIPDGMDPIMVQEHKFVDKDAQQFNQMVQEQQRTLDDYSNVQQKYSHETDTDDIPDGLDPVMVMDHSYHDHDQEDYNKQVKDFQKMVDQNEFVQIQYDHENDTEDVPEGHHPWVGHVPHSASFVKYEHENDTDDVPDGHHPWVGHVPHSASFVQLDRPNMKYIKDLDPMDTLDDTGSGLAKRRTQNIQIEEQEQNHAQLSAQEKEDEKNAAEVSEIYDQQYGKPAAVTNLQLGRISHENDTDDIALEVGPVAYNQHHSRKWNAEVDRQAVEIENQIKVEENTKISEERARQQAEQKLAEEKAEAKRIAEEKARQAKKEVKKVEIKKNHQTVDFAELYKDISMVQTRDYVKHSPFFEAQVEKKAQEFENQIKKEEESENQIKLEKLMAQENKKMPSTLERRHPNPSVDFDEMYDGVKLVQLNSEFSHDEDPDDIVPDNAQVYQPKVAETKEDDGVKVDFTGQKFTEDY